MKNKIEEISKLFQSLADIFGEIAEEIETGGVVEENKTFVKNEVTSDKGWEDDNDNGEVTADELKEMSYNDLKAYAKSRGIKAIGSRKQLLANILKTLDKEDEEENTEEEKTVNSSKSKKMPVSAKKSAVPVDEEDDEEPEEEGENDDLRAELASMDTKELADILSEAGLSVKGKKEALITRIIKAVEDGLIEFEEEDEGTAEEYEDTEETEEGEENADNSGEYDPNDLKNPNMTKERKDAISALMKELQADIKKKKITDDDMTEFLIAAGYTQKEIKGLDDIAEIYLQEKALFINDEGEEVEKEEPYSINGEPACCGKLLEKDGDTYICSVCGAEYEVDEEE